MMPQGGPPDQEGGAVSSGRLPAMPAPRPELSVVVLCYRSAVEAPPFVEALRDALDLAGLDWEMVLVANDFPGSDDPTAAVVRELAGRDPRLRPVTREKEGMMGWDMRSGLEEARGRCLAVIDGDGQMPAEDVVRVHRELEAGGFDLVKTVRVRRDDGPYRRFVSRVYNLLFRLLFPGLGCSDVNSKPKVLTREAYERMELASDGWFVDAEIMIEARRLGLAMAEVPTVFRSLEHRASFVRPSAILEFLRHLVAYRLRRRSRVGGARPVREEDREAHRAGAPRAPGTRSSGD